MQIENSTLQDLAKIFELYRIATDFMKSKKQVSWPEFSKELIVDEIQNKRQWKITIENQIACIWATTRNDELIWGKDNKEPSIYIHRIATNQDFRGQNLAKNIVNWADEYGVTHDLEYIRMDTVGYNEGLIKHYKKIGFEFLGTKELTDTTGLPDHYNDDVVCLFQREILK